MDGREVSRERWLRSDLYIYSRSLYARQRKRRLVSHSGAAAADMVAARYLLARPVAGIIGDNLVNGRQPIQPRRLPRQQRQQ